MMFKYDVQNYPSFAEYVLKNNLFKILKLMLNSSSICTLTCKAVKRDDNDENLDVFKDIMQSKRCHKLTYCMISLTR